MNHLKHGLAAALALLSLGLAHALPVSWTISNLETAKDPSAPSVTKKVNEWKPPKINFHFTDDAQMQGTMPNGNQIQINSIELVLEAEGSMRPFLAVYQGTNPLFVSSRQYESSERTYYYSPTHSESSITLKFEFDSPVYLEEGIDYTLVFGTYKGAEFVPYQGSGSYMSYALENSNAESAMFEDNLLTPFIIMSGTYTPRSVPEPTALALLALGGAAVLLRRPKP